MTATFRVFLAICKRLQQSRAPVPLSNYEKSYHLTEEHYQNNKWVYFRRINYLLPFLKPFLGIFDRVFQLLEKIGHN